MARLPLLEGRDNNPCPQANGTTIGTDQQFILLCGSDVGGDVLDRPDAADFQACVDICSSFHPKCDAVSFNKRKCELRGNVDPGRTRPSKFADAAVGQFPAASSNCATLGGTQQLTQPNAANFNTFCNFIINGKDLSQAFAATFQDCMGQCAATAACSAVSFDASMSQGFKNCYLKTGASASDNIADQGIDTAVVQNNAAAAAPAPAPAPASSAAPAPAPSPATTTVVQPTTVIPDPVTVSAAPVPAPPATTITPLTPAPATTGGASFFTPPGAGSATAAPPPPAPASVATETVISIITSVSVSDAVSVTQLITVPVTTELTTTPPAVALGTSAADSAPSTSSSSTTAQLGPAPTDSSSSSRAWIAAPVVGSMAALVVVVIVFVMLGRRRMMRSSRPGTASSRESGDSGGGLFAGTWLPGSPRLRNRIMGPSVVGSGMGNFSSVTGKVVERPGRTASVRSSVFGVLGKGGGVGGGGGGGAERLGDVEEGGDGFGAAAEKKSGGEGGRDVTPVYEVRNGRMELRESLNGLSQHRWSERKITEYVYW